MISEFPIAYKHDITDEFLEDVLGILRKCYGKHGPGFSFILYGAPHLFLISPDASRFVLTNETDALSARGAALEVGVKLFGDAFLFLDGSRHIAVRQVFQPCFRVSVDSIPEISTAVSSALRLWAGQSTICVFRESQKLFLTIGCERLFGWNPGGSIDFLIDLLQTLASGLYFVDGQSLRSGLFQRSLAAKRQLYEFWDSMLGDLNLSSEQLAHKVVAPDGGNILYDNLNMILWAAFDTCSATFSFLIDQVLKEPSLLDPIVHPNPGARLGDKSEKRRYVEALVLETLRLWPPVYLLSRTAISDLSFEGRTIPVGTIVNLAPILLHRLPDLYDDPNRFQGHRFLRNDLATRQIGKYIPFGAGRKGCVGRVLAMFEMIEIFERIFESATLEPIKLIAGELWVPGLRPKEGPTVRVKLN